MFLGAFVLAGDTDGLSEDSVIAISAGDAVVARRTGSTPCTVVGPAVVASTLKSALRVEASLLVKRNSVRAVACAEDVSTTTAMVTTVEDGEGTGTCGRLAQRGAVVGLPVVSCGCTSDGTHVVLIPLV